ncbi:MAG TPA: Maf family protein [Anaerolineae bacterium]|jgi:septum formation protein|nr:Maf family protein [Anaerolineae bacterium]
MVCGASGIRRLILASASPRRRQLLALLGLRFVVKAADIDETPLPGEAPTEMVVRVARAKAYAIPTVRRDELVIAADTTVVLDGQVLGKPLDARDAVDMLRRLRNRDHVVYTGLTVWHPASRCMITELGQSVVWMRDYADAEIEAYVATGDPMDKAGAYAIQHTVFNPVARVDGCWLNVMGLPLCHLRRALCQFGIEVPSDVPGTCEAFNQIRCEEFAEILAPGAA